MAGIAEVLTALVPLMTAIPGVVTVRKTVPPAPLTADQCPAIFFETMPPDVGGGRSNTRVLIWNVRIWISVGVRSVNIDDDFDLITPLPQLVIDALDKAATFEGLLDRTVQYGEPMFGHPEQGTAFGTTAWNDKQYFETAVNAVFTTSRVGGFGPYG